MAQWKAASARQVKYLQRTNNGNGALLLLQRRSHLEQRFLFNHSRCESVVNLCQTLSQVRLPEVH